MWGWMQMYANVTKWPGHLLSLNDCMVTLESDEDHPATQICQNSSLCCAKVCLRGPACTFRFNSVHVRCVYNCTSWLGIQHGWSRHRQGKSLFFLWWFYCLRVVAITLYGAAVDIRLSIIQNSGAVFILGRLHKCLFVNIMLDCQKLL